MTPKRDYLTMGEYVQLHGQRVQAEITACGKVLEGNCDEMPQEYNPLTAFTEHLVEALDAILDLAAIQGAERKAIVLRQAMARHGLQWKD